MTSRLGLLVGLVACLGMGCRDRAAVKITLSFPNFKPGCVRMVLQDAQDPEKHFDEEIRSTLADKSPGGAVTVAAFAGEGWGKDVTVIATAYEQQCGEGPEFTVSKTFGMGTGVIPVDLQLDVVDRDGDGYVSRESGGTDCSDGDASVNPGRTELCNNRDDNCDNRTDETFEKVGQQCGTAGACETWACNTEGGLSCKLGAPRWYRDQDGDGEGTAQDSRESCTQPSGYVNNSRDCDDTNKARFSTAVELCNNIDDNCDNTVDEGFNVGASCMDGICASQRACVSTTEAACKSVQKTWYRDQDNDRHGATGAGEASCQSTPPTGYVASSDDCDDTKANVYTGAPEQCDALDNDCDNTVDEGFNIGATCNPGNDCTGTTQCSSLTATECRPTTPPTQYYVDNDQDGYGQATGPLTCNPPAGYATRGGDCRDGNPYTHPGAPELCDKEDNDCDAATNEVSVCPTGGGSWASYSTAASDTWRSVALYNNGGVWITGGDKLSHRKPPQTSLDDVSTCTAGEDVYAIATNPSTGDALLGGNNGFLARYYPATTGCTDKGRQSSLSADIRGVHLVPFQDKIENVFVAVNTRVVINRGRAIRVLDNIGTGYDNEEISYELKDVNGPARELMFAVGGPLDATASPHIYRFNTGTGNWDELSVPLGGASLNGVWVVSSKLAYAVGDNGTFLTWNGTAWSKVTGVPNESFSSVVAFGTQSLYVTTLSGKLLYFNGTTWTELFKTPGPPSQLLDIAANSPGDIWVVGSKGARYHWPQ